MNYLSVKVPTDKGVGISIGQKNFDSELTTWEVAQERRKEVEKVKVGTLKPRVKEENGVKSPAEKLDKNPLFEGNT